MRKQPTRLLTAHHSHLHSCVKGVILGLPDVDFLAASFPELGHSSVRPPNHHQVRLKPDMLRLLAAPDCHSCASDAMLRFLHLGLGFLARPTDAQSTALPKTAPKSRPGVSPCKSIKFLKSKLVKF